MMIAIIALSAALGGFVQTITGFGTGVIIMSVLPYFYDLYLAPSLSVSICFAFNLAVAVQYRKYIDWKAVALPLVCYMLCSSLAIILEGGWNLELLNILFGTFLVAISVYYLLIAKNAKLKDTRATAAACGAVSGLCAGLFGIGGPTLALYYINATEDYPHYMANIHIIFVLNSLLSVILRVVHGYYTLKLLPLTLVGFAGVYIGKYLGTKVVSKLNADKFKKVVYIFVGLSGLATLAEHIFKA